jgi:hypothetical protein
MGIRKWVEFLCYIFPLSKWDPYPFFYRLEGARYLDEPLAMHGCNMTSFLQGCDDILMIEFLIHWCFDVL